MITRFVRKTNLFQGFTLIEILLVMAIISILSSFAVVNLIRPQTKANLDTTMTTLIGDLKEQQLKSMIGDTQGESTSSYGIYFESNRYTLFKGNSYNPNDANNYSVSIDDGIVISNSFPSNQVVFLKRSGEVVGFVDLQNTITASSNGESKSISLNVLGTISE